MPFTKSSSTPMPSTEGASAPTDGMSEKEHTAAAKILEAVYAFRTPDGFDPSKLFHRKVNKRVLPTYYDTIKEPIAMSTIKQKLLQRTYASFKEFVRDFALIAHNAQVFNRPDSGAFQDALVIRGELERLLGVEVASGTITAEMARLPDLGEIPTYEDVIVEDPAEAEEESSDDEGEEDDDEEGEELDDEGRPVKKRKVPRSGAASAKRQAASEDPKKARGRPPKLLTPTEARIQAIIKGVRKPKNSRGQLMIKDFDRLPDKQIMPEYYSEIKNPMAYDILKRKVKRKKYLTVEAFMAELNLMFNNAKQYNTDDSAIYAHAKALQIEAGKLYDIEAAKPDSTFADEEGKTPLPTGILHNGELYRVGDWIHIQNPNDLTKPIPAQIYRTYKAADGRSMVNVCWYYRPEQTVHRFDKHFYPNEVVKTGRYRDHGIEEVEGKCFIMFFTRYFKGRPRGLAEGQEIYVCEARYNETKHEFNKIKTWASCLPDEVRDRDYPMDLYEHSRKLKKFPSPIAYLLKDEQKEADEMPKVQWGAEGAPPKIGAVHRRPRGERDSPPPEATPPPQPKAPTPQQLHRQSSYHGTPLQQQGQQTGARPVGRPPLGSYTAGAQQAQGQGQYSGLAVAPSPSLQRPASSMQQQNSFNTPQTPQPSSAALPRPTAPTSGYRETAAPVPQSLARPTTAQQQGSYRDPAPVEVYTLPDQANLSIPYEVREQYQRDEMGRVLFFTAPPVSVETRTGSGVRGHSVRYLAEKARRKEALERKRKVREEDVLAQENRFKQQRLDDSFKAGDLVQGVKRQALRALEQQLRDSVAGDELDDEHLGRWSGAQGLAVEQGRIMEERAGAREGGRRVRLVGGGVFGDDWDNRVS
ncbi:hypothetical protein LTR56_017224 [Elasticomyces elasticus]|nr:hypothetical protein LTR56_017224 [Elasticomyces elasticus]KAK3644878.1 hypothetical protein LTR22_015024 [Elasticomyces elasticus]KAK4923347.1 hypothetical protein LTR49_009417 [Elasticomyces elasticus]KAK5751157.1 hypothetical protein LTS12_018791 [Elasticomyces elasticus]